MTTITALPSRDDRPARSGAAESDSQDRAAFAAGRRRIDARAGAEAASPPSATKDPGAVAALPTSENPVHRYLSGRSARPSSQRGYRDGLRMVQRLLVESGLGEEDTPLEKFPWHCVTPAVASKFFERACLRYPNSKSRSRYLCALRRMLTECSRIGLLTLQEREAIIDCLPSRRSAPLAAPGSEIALDELVRILRDPWPADDVKAVRDQAMLEVLAATGMRSAELVDLLVADWSPADSTLMIRRQKNQLPRVAHLTGGARLALEAWIDVRGDQGGALFNAHPKLQTERHIAVGHVNPILRARCEAVGITRRITSHDFRRTAITRMLRAGVDPFTVARCIGHQEVTTTMLYDRRTSDEDASAFLLLELPAGPRQPIQRNRHSRDAR